MRCFVTVVSFWFLLVSAVSSAEAAVVQVDANTDSLNLSPYIRYFADDTGNRTIEDILRDNTVLNWKNHDGTSPNFGYDTRPYWVAISLENTSSNVSEPLLEFIYPLLDDVQIYLFDGKRISHQWQLGDSQPFADRVIEHRRLVVPLQLQANSRNQLYVRVQTTSSVQLPMELRSEKSFYKDDLMEAMKQSVFYGVLMAMIAYNLFIFISVRHVSYLYYVSYVVSFGLLTASLDGFGFQLVWPEHPEWNAYAVTVFTPASTLLAMLFSINFLSTKRYNLRCHYVLMGCAAIQASLIALNGTLPYSTLIKPVLLMAIVSAFSVLVSGFVVWRAGNHSARFYCLAWATLLLGIIMYAINKLGILPRTVVTENAMQFGQLVEVLLLSFALADRINHERRAKLKAQQLANEKDKLARQEHEKYLEAKLKAQEDEMLAIEAQAESKAKSEFLAAMSHEIRMPMNGVIGMSEMLRNANLDNQTKYFVDIIYSSGKALLTIINDILDYSKIEAGKMDIEAIDFDLDRLVVECASVFNLTAEKKAISLTASIKPGTPTLIQGDPTRLRQILLNLLGNAFKFTSQGGVSLRIHQLPSNQDDLALKFEVRDTGIGISEAQQKKLFSAFAQAESATNRKYGGTGLGLNISKKLAELMGGEIGVESVQGKGSCFWFTIRFKPASPAYKVVGHFDEKDFAGKRILLVDDSHEYVDILREQMQSWDITVDAAYHGKEGLDKVLMAEAEGKPFDMIILDYQMPGMTGVEVSQALQQSQSAEKPKCVLITAMSESPEQPELEAAGILFSVKKPIGASDLAECIGKALFPDHLINSEASKDRDPHDLSRLHLLVAEDNAVNQLVIKSMLKKLGVDAEVVIDGKEALTRYGENPGYYDVILMDCMMPEMDGYEATRAIRDFEQEEKIPRTPIFALTAHAMNEHREKSLACGMDDHICKPIEINELREKLLGLVAKNEAA